MISNNMIIAGDRTSIGAAGSVIFYNSVLLNKVTFMWSSCGRASSRATGWPTRLSSGNFPPTCGPGGVGYFWKYLPHHQSAKWDNLYWISPGRTTWSGAVPPVARFVKYEQVDVGSCNGLQQVPGWSRDLPTTGRKESSNLLIPPSLTQETGPGQLQWWLCCYSASIACRDFIILKLWTEQFEVRNGEKMREFAWKMQSNWNIQTFFLLWDFCSERQQQRRWETCEEEDEWMRYWWSCDGSWAGLGGNQRTLRVVIRQHLHLSLTAGIITGPGYNYFHPRSGLITGKILCIINWKYFTSSTENGFLDFINKTQTRTGLIVRIFPKFEIYLLVPGVGGRRRLQCEDVLTESVLMIMRSLQASAWNWLEIKRPFYLNISSRVWLFVRSLQFTRMWVSHVKLTVC